VLTYIVWYMTKVVFSIKFNSTRGVITIVVGVKGKGDYGQRP